MKCEQNSHKVVSLYELHYLDSLGHFVYFFYSEIIINKNVWCVQLQSMILSKVHSKLKHSTLMIVLLNVFLPQRS